MVQRETVSSIKLYSFLDHTYSQYAGYIDILMWQPIPNAGAVFGGFGKMFAKQFSVTGYSGLAGRPAAAAAEAAALISLIPSTCMLCHGRRVQCLDTVYSSKYIYIIESRSDERLYSEIRDRIIGAYDLILRRRNGELIYRRI